MVETTPVAAATPRFDDITISRAVSALTTITDPDIVLQNLGITRDKLRAMETDDEISAALETRREALLSTPWTLDPGDGGLEDDVMWVRSVLSPWADDCIRSAFNAVPYGYSVMRMAQRETEEGRTAIGWIGEWPMERFSIRGTGQLEYKPLDGSRPYIAQEPEFWLVRRNPTWRNPYGEAMLSRLYWPWFFRYNSWRFWMQFIERFGEPLLLGKSIDPGKMVEVLREMGYEAVVAVGEDDSLEAVIAAGKGEHDLLIKAIDRRIQKVILGQTLTSDVDGKGSYAAAKVHDSVRIDKRSADMRLVGGLMQRIVNWLWSANELRGEPPVFRFDTGVEIDEGVAKSLSVLSDAGWLATEQLITRLFKDVKPGDLEFVRRDQAVVGTMSTLTGHGSAEIRLAKDKGSRFTRPQQLIENMADAALDAGLQPVSNDEIMEAIHAATGPEDLEARLAELVGPVDGDAFTELLERALFAADVIGYVAEQKGEP